MQSDIENKLKDLDSKIEALIIKLLKQNKSKELIISLANKELESYIMSQGLEEVLNRYSDSLVIEALSTVQGFTKLTNTEKIIESVGLSTEQLASTYRDTILGYFQANTGRLKAELLNALLDGTPTPKIAERLRATFTRVSDGTMHFLTDANINTVIQTSYSNVSRLATAKAFEDDKTQRFEYFGGVIPTSSDTCKWLIENQDPKGYTKEQIDRGIETPHGRVDWQGRQPNYNCLHTWVPVG